QQLFVHGQEEARGAGREPYADARVAGKPRDSGGAARERAVRQPRLGAPAAQQVCVTARPLFRPDPPLARREARGDRVDMDFFRDRWARSRHGSPSGRDVRPRYSPRAYEIHPIDGTYRARQDIFCIRAPRSGLIMLTASPRDTASPVFERRNHITDEVVTSARAMTPAEACALADAAAAAFPAWSALGPNARRAKLLRAADVLESRAADFARVMAAEAAMSAGWAGFNVHLAAGMLREAASMTTQITGEIIPADKPNCFSMAVRQPAGVVLGIAPWNAPVILGIRAIAMPLACGNTVILKASEISPGTHALIGEVLAEAGLGDGVVNVVTNALADAPVVVEALIAHPAVRRVNFTGSTRVGRTIAELCARQLKPVLLELGGKAPLVVLDDADLAQAVDAAAFGGFMNQGQICMATERIVVDEAVADAFVERLGRKAESLSTGDPTKEDVVLGAV